MAFPSGIIIEDVTLFSATLGLFTLPNLMWMGSSPDWPVSANKQIEEAAMMDKSRRVAFFEVKREWGIILGFLTKGQLDDCNTYNDLPEILDFVNNNEDNTSYCVFISSFGYKPERIDVRRLERYGVEMTLREV